MFKPYISIIIPVYKVQYDQLIACIESLLNQKYENVEMLFVDDGSPDDCGKILDEYALKDKRMKVFHKPNGGVSNARNYALDRMQGDYVLFVDGDDMLGDDAINKMVSLLENDPKASIFYQYSKLYNKTEIVIPYTNQKVIEYIKGKDCELNIYDMRIMSYITHALLPKEAIEGLYFDEKLKMCEDILFNFLAYQRIEHGYYLNEICYYYRVNDTSAVRLYDPHVYQSYERTIEEVSKLTLEGKAKQAYYSFIGVTYNNLILNNIFNNGNKENILKKIRAMKDLSEKKYYAKMFKHINDIDLPKSRQIFILLNHYHLYFISYCIVMLKKKIDQLRSKRG